MAVARIVFGIAVLVALGVALAHSWKGVEHRIARAPLDELFAALALALVALGCSGAAWLAVLRGLGVQVSVRRAAPVVFIGQLGKYVPGSVWAVVAQMELGRRAGLSRTPVAAAYTVSLLVNLVTGALVSLACLPWLVGHGSDGYLWTLALLPVGFVLLHPAVLRRLLDLAVRLTRRPALPVPLSARSVLAVAAWSVGTWLGYGAQAVILVVALGGPQTGRMLPVAIGGYALATVAGVLFIIAPAGAGVREAVLYTLLVIVATSVTATSVVLLSRLVVTLSDLLGAFLAAGLATGGPLRPLRVRRASLDPGTPTV